MGLRGVFSKLRFIANPAIQLLWVPLLYVILGNLGIILSLWEAGDRTLDEQQKLPSGPETFDFIVGTERIRIQNKIVMLHNFSLSSRCWNRRKCRSLQIESILLCFAFGIGYA